MKIEKEYTPTLTPAEWRDLHNAYNQLNQVYEDIGEVLHPTITAPLVEVLHEIQQVMFRCNAEEQKIDDEIGEITDNVKSANRLLTNWCLRTPDFEAAHPYKNAQFVTDGTRQVKINGRAWVDLWRAANELIVRDDYTVPDHCFIEGFKAVRGDKTVLKVLTGS